MSTYNHRAQQIDKDELERRIEHARQFFIALCHDSILVRLLGERSSWAIVGGAVRDTLLSTSWSVRPLFILWPDVDVAVSVSTRELPVVQDPPEHTRVAVNHFGGLKIWTKEIGTLDVWTWSEPGGDRCSIDEWKRRLELVDFGLNAVAFVWPEREVVMHPRWQEDLRSRHVEKLAPQSPNREFQPIRAVALSTKLGQSFGMKVDLGKEIRRDLRWLVKDATLSQATRALEYLNEKTQTRRWSRTTITRFIKTCKHYKCSPMFQDAIVRVLGNGFYSIFSTSRNSKNSTSSNIELPN